MPATKVYEDEHALAFNDIFPQAPTHILVIPKGPYVSWDDFSRARRRTPRSPASSARSARSRARRDWSADGYRLLANVGQHSGQEVPHLHVHLFAGGPLGPMLAR